MTLRLNGTTSGYVEIDSAATSGNHTIVLPSSNGTANQFLKNGTTAGALGWSSLVETAAGVGIGTASPNFTGFAGRTVTLNLDAATNGGYEIGKAGNLVAVFGVEAGTNDVRFGTTSSAALGLWANNQERMRISSNGSVIISHTSNIYQLYLVNGAGSGLTDTLLRMDFSGYAPNNATAKYFYCGDTLAIRAELRSNGGLANFQANNVNLSDINTKKDISPAAGTWDCIKEWEIVNYRYKDQPDDADLNLGVIAQQVAESCPEVITVFEEAKDDRPEKLGVKEQQMYWMAIKALQEAQVRIETLEAANAALETRLAALEAQQ